jgi:hypothetical protein
MYFSWEQMRMTFALVRAALPNFSSRSPPSRSSPSSALETDFPLGGAMSTSLASAGEVASSSESVWRRLEGRARLHDMYVC